MTLTSTLLLSVMEYYVSKKCPLVSTRQTLKTNLIGSFLDRKLVYDVPKGSYSDLNDETTLNIADIYGETYQEDHQYSVVTTDGTYVLSEGNIVKLIGNYEEQSIIVGLDYLFLGLSCLL